MFCTKGQIEIERRSQLSGLDTMDSLDFTERRRDGERGKQLPGLLQILTERRRTRKTASWTFANSHGETENAENSFLDFCKFSRRDGETENAENIFLDLCKFSRRDGETENAENSFLDLMQILKERRRDGERGKQLPGLMQILTERRRDGERGKQLPGLRHVHGETATENCLIPQYSTRFSVSRRRRTTVSPVNFPIALPLSLPVVPQSGCGA